MTTLLTAIVLWLSANFGLPAANELPRIEYVPPVRMATLRDNGTAGDRAPSGATQEAPLSAASEIVAVYDPRRKTIYLPEGWTGATAAELSVLVHEMVHHLQHAAGTKFACPQEQEKTAFDAQEKWLGLFGHSLLSEFAIDPMTRLVRTNCGY